MMKKGHRLLHRHLSKNAPVSPHSALYINVWTHLYFYVHYIFLHIYILHIRKTPIYFLLAICIINYSNRFLSIIFPWIPGEKKPIHNGIQLFLFLNKHFI